MNLGNILLPWAELCISWYFASLVSYILSSGNTASNWLSLSLALALLHLLQAESIVGLLAVGLSFVFLSGALVMETPLIRVSVLKMLQSWTVPRTCLSLFLSSASVWNTFSSLIFLAAYVVLCSQLMPCPHDKPSFVYFSIGKAGFGIPYLCFHHFYCLTISFHISLLAFSVTGLYFVFILIAC